jgi:hypothetical protein
MKWTSFLKNTTYENEHRMTKSMSPKSLKETESIIKNLSTRNTVKVNGFPGKL